MFPEDQKLFHFLHLPLKRSYSKWKCNNFGATSRKKKRRNQYYFLPDAFFGSLPLASNYAGRGNGPDSLTYQFNSLAFTKEQLQEYIKTIPQRLVISNYPDKFTAGGVVGLDLLLGKKSTDIVFIML